MILNMDKIQFENRAEIGAIIYIYYDYAVKLKFILYVTYFASKIF